MKNIMPISKMPHMVSDSVTRNIAHSTADHIMTLQTILFVIELLTSGTVHLQKLSIHKY